MTTSRENTGEEATDHGAAAPKYLIARDCRSPSRGARRRNLFAAFLKQTHQNLT
ncbi:UNVERIFIED_CONTAM: hypothetical protein PYX00_002931 [Menopon gallinae]|uniref:Uncharacterized protein n=1 Tax=Menopon gallinae TaxID=328185 RepID=A0AAW2HZQ5_9NEOP